MFLICGYCPCLSRLIFPYFFVCLLGGCLITLLFFTDYHICIFPFIPIGKSFLRSIYNCITGFLDLYISDLSSNLPQLVYN